MNDISSAITSCFPNIFMILVLPELSEFIMLSANTILNTSVIADSTKSNDFVFCEISSKLIKGTTTAGEMLPKTAPA